MKNHTPTLNWATDCLLSKGYTLPCLPKIILETPWSTVIRFLTSKETVYLKQTPPSLSLEPNVIQLLADQCHASVPTVIAINHEQHCFLMKDAGQSLREYLKTTFQQSLLQQAIQQYITIQRTTENHIEPFLTLGVPDWRLDKLPKLYDQIISSDTFLIAEGMTEKELKTLQGLSQKIAAQCERLSQYQIPETFVQSDFQNNNILIDPNTKKMIFIDLGETVITHPFFSLYNFLRQINLRGDIKTINKIYRELYDTCFENWLEFATKNQLVEAFMLAKKLWPIYSALAFYRLMMSVGPETLRSYFANKPSRLAGFFRVYMASN